MKMLDPIGSEPGQKKKTCKIFIPYFSNVNGGMWQDDEAATNAV